MADLPAGSSDNLGHSIPDFLGSFLVPFDLMTTRHGMAHLPSQLPSMADTSSTMTSRCSDCRVNAKRSTGDEIIEPFARVALPHDECTVQSIIDAINGTSLITQVQSLKLPARTNENKLSNEDGIRGSDDQSVYYRDLWL